MATNNTTKPDLESLTVEEIKVLIGIQEKPLATYEELAEMTKISKSVVFRIVKKLENPEIKPPFLKVIAVPNLSNMGLELLDVLVEAETPKEIEMTIKLCKSHPYIWYYARCYGKINGFYIQFRAPHQSIEHIKELFTILKSKNYIKSSQLFQFGNNSILTHPKLKTWNFDSLSWNFKWKEWFQKDMSDESPPDRKENSFSSVKQWMKQRDITLLTELLANSRRKNSEMIESLKKIDVNLSPQTFSRDMKKIKENLILNHRTEIHPESFDLLNPVLIYGIGNQDELADLEKRVHHYPIPIQSTFKRTKHSMFWYLNISTFSLSDLLEKLRPMLQDLKFFFIDTPKSKTYFPEPSSFDEKIKAWNVSESYLISDVINEIEKKV
ncbi:MAG: winged helix-turn-helix transcriptional regulator [Promethearchaeota archaeon]